MNEVMTYDAGISKSDKKNTKKDIIKMIGQKPDIDN